MVASSRTGGGKGNKWKALPPAARRRVKALKKLQWQSTLVSAEFHKEMFMLECKYHELCLPYYRKRKVIGWGVYRPTDEECDLPSDDERLRGLKKLDAEDTPPVYHSTGYYLDVFGVPGFWLSVLLNAGVVTDPVSRGDEALLRELVDINLINFYDDCRDKDATGFVLEFHFAPNDYFSDEVLKKVYFVDCQPDPEDPFSFDGIDIYKCTGTFISWYEGKNVTVKTIRLKKKDKEGVVVTKKLLVPTRSFFHFFDPPYVPEGQENIDKSTANQLALHYELGVVLRETVVPRAVLLYSRDKLRNIYETDSGEEEVEEEEIVEEEEDKLEDGSEEEAKREGDSETEQKPNLGGDCT